MNLLRSISLHIGLDVIDTQSLILSSPIRYKVYKIKKRSGNGFRTIAQPSPEVKEIQRFICEEVLSQFPIHHSAFAYRRGMSIKHNASLHKDNKFILKIDFKDFFHSIVPDDIDQLLIDNTELSFNDIDIIILKKSLFWRKSAVPYYLCLSIGAPSSPMLSNVVMYRFDTILYQYCAKNNIAYSRYSDDLSFSTNIPGVLNSLYAFIVKLCAEIHHPRLSINSEKTIYSSKKGRRSITGLVLSNDGRISIGRIKKREISAMLHHFKMGKLEKEQFAQLAGYLAYANDIDSSYINSLEEKYNVDCKSIVKELMAFSTRKST